MSSPGGEHRGRRQSSAPLPPANPTGPFACPPAARVAAAAAARLHARPPSLPPSHLSRPPPPPNRRRQVDGIGNLVELNGRFAAELDAPVLMVRRRLGGLRCLCCPVRLGAPALTACLFLCPPFQQEMGRAPSRGGDSGAAPAFPQTMPDANTPVTPPPPTPSPSPSQVMDLHRDEEVAAGELYNRAMISKQDLQAEHAGERGGLEPRVCWPAPRRALGVWVQAYYTGMRAAGCRTSWKGPSYAVSCWFPTGFRLVAYWFLTGCLLVSD